MLFYFNTNIRKCEGFHFPLLFSEAVPFVPCKLVLVKESQIYGISNHGKSNFRIKNLK